MNGHLIDGSKGTAAHADLAGRTRRLVGMERHYRCSACGGQHRSWSRLAACPDCGERMTTAIIRRAALAPA